MSVSDRTARMAELRANGRWAVWQQVDAAAISDPVEVAEFVLRRLYPEQREEWFAEVLGQLQAARAAGTWSGFHRPASTDRNLR